MNDHHDFGLSDKDAGCNCGTHSHHEETGSHHQEAVSHHEASATKTATTDFLVDGMTCSHCVASVTEEISALSGVDSVSVDLKPGGSSTVSVASSSPIDTEAVRAAVEEAGYSLAGASR
jgi:copper chaperone